jgi:hypothetical protein
MECGKLGRNVRVYFERPSKNPEYVGFDFAEGNIPDFQFSKTYGFSEDEIFKLQRYLRNNSPLIWEYAQKGGGLECLKR